MAIITSVPDTTKLTLTPVDDALYTDFRELFPDMNVAVWYNTLLLAVSTSRQAVSVVVHGINRGFMLRYRFSIGA
jgi:polysaccharide biosynthesis protein